METCATDEICNSAGTACQCNAAAYQFVRGASPPVNFTCTGAKFNIQVSKCWLEKNGYDTSDIRLNSTNSNCSAGREIVDGISEMTLYRPLISSDCNTAAELNTTHVIYTNHLYIFGKTNPIRITNDAVMNISCAYPLNINVALNVTLHPILGTTEINGPNGTGSYAAIMMAFKDSQYSIPLSEDDSLMVEDTIYLSVRVPDLDVNTSKLKVVNIYASPTNSSDQKYYLLQNGCPGSDVPADQLTVDSNGVGIESRFAMKVFQIANSNAVYLFADLKLCTTDCATTCPSQAKDASSDGIAGRVNIFLNAGKGLKWL
ncbi:pancreatic secretory granule membrane major glycoprotein GP2-like [Aquarana catesbeiana]|uniref:pancreatic secretory granule membrane major glycoprotein GP2-like n=1 Tax=Aquarana catesbeiana TaxID=8400 RepID=UPI003CC98A4B